MPRAGRWSGSKSGRQIQLLAAAGILTIVAVLPPASLDHAPSICLVRRAGGQWCPGCGMTRALAWLLRGEIRASIRSNWRVIVVAPLLSWVGFTRGQGKEQRDPTGGQHEPAQQHSIRR